MKTKDVMRVTAGRHATAHCTLSTERSGNNIILKFSKRVEDAVDNTWTHAVPEWQHDDDGGLLVIGPPANGERGYKLTNSRRLRLHISFPRRGVILEAVPVVLADPVMKKNALVFTLPADVKLPISDEGNQDGL